MAEERRCPLAGGAIVQGWSRQWVFWLNVPIGVAAVALAGARIDESTGLSRPMDLPGMGLAGIGLLGIVWALVQGNELGWGAPAVAGPLILGLLLIAGFVCWELLTPSPMIPMRFFSRRGFAVANATSLFRGRSQVSGAPAVRRCSRALATLFVGRSGLRPLARAPEQGPNGEGTSLL